MTHNHITHPNQSSFDPDTIRQVFDQGLTYAEEITAQNDLAERLPEIEPPFQELARIALIDNQRNSVSALQETAGGAFQTLVAEQTVREGELGELLAQRREATAAHLNERAGREAALRQQKQKADEIISIPEDQANAIIAAELRRFDLEVRDLPETKERVQAVLAAIRQVREVRGLGALAGQLLVVPKLLQETSAPETSGAPEEKPPAPAPPPTKSPKAAAPKAPARKTTSRGRRKRETEKAPTPAESTASKTRRISACLAAQPGAAMTAREVAQNIFKDKAELTKEDVRDISVLLAPTHIHRIRTALRAPADSSEQPKDIQVGWRIVPSAKPGARPRRERVYRALRWDEKESSQELFGTSTEKLDDGRTIEWEETAPLAVEPEKTPAARPKAPAQSPKTSSTRTRARRGAPKPGKRAKKS